MLYTPDYDYINGKKHLDALDSIEGKLIQHYVAEKDKHIEKLNEQIKEMQEVFNGIRRFTKF